jgi:hypothetical protein
MRLYLYILTILWLEIQSVIEIEILKVENGNVDNKNLIFQYAV